MCIPKYRGQNLASWCLRLWLFWTALTSCCPLSWLPIWLWSEVVDPCFIHCLIFMQKLLFLVFKKLQTTLNRWCIVFFYQLWENMSPTLKIAFSLTNVHEKWWIYSLLISSTPLLSHTTSILDQSKRVCGVFLVFSGTTAEIWATWAFSIICVCTTLFKVSIPFLNHCFWWSRVWITLIKPLFCLNSIFFLSESNALLTHEIQIFLLFWIFATVSKK